MKNYRIRAKDPERVYDGNRVDTGFRYHTTWSGPNPPKEIDTAVSILPIDTQVNFSIGDTVLHYERPPEIEIQERRIHAPIIGHIAGWKTIDIKTFPLPDVIDSDLSPRPFEY